MNQFEEEEESALQPWQSTCTKRHAKRCACEALLHLSSTQMRCQPLIFSLKLQWNLQHERHNALSTQEKKERKTRPSRKKEKVEFYLILLMTLHFQILSNSINYFIIRFVWSFIENIFWFVFSLSLSLSCVSHVFLMCFSCVGGSDHVTCVVGEDEALERL